jgi:hypothetical protein
MLIGCLQQLLESSYFRSSRLKQIVIQCIVQPFYKMQQAMFATFLRHFVFYTVFYTFFKQYFLFYCYIQYKHTIKLELYRINFGFFANKNIILKILLNKHHKLSINAVAVVLPSFFLFYSALNTVEPKYFLT